MKLLLKPLWIGRIVIDALAILKMNSQVDHSGRSFMQWKVEESPDSCIAADVACHLIACDLVLFVDLL